MRIPAWSSSFPLMCVVFSAIWLGFCILYRADSVVVDSLFLVAHIVCVCGVCGGRGESRWVLVMRGSRKLT